jgi:hypothetical protein
MCAGDFKICVQSKAHIYNKFNFKGIQKNILSSRETFLLGDRYFTV